MSKINLPLGIDLFSNIREKNLYYVDKTSFIEELLSQNFAVNLITRPRRFGKTLMMSMLNEFLDINKNSARLFEGLAVSKNTVFCEEWIIADRCCF